MSKITEKIAKLLALAESPYEEEAKAALLQARRLMAEHKLMPEDIEPQENKNVIQECVGVTCTKLSSPWTVREMCNSYGWGFCRGLSAAFQKQEAEHQEWGLVMVVPQAVEDAVSKMKRSSYKISPQSSINRQYAAMGYADGQEFDMRRRLEPSA